jgi:hypothetical protein
VSFPLAFPLAIILGIATFLSFMITLYVGYSIRKGRAKFSLEGHFRMAIVSVAIAIAHMTTVYIAFFT